MSTLPIHERFYTFQGEGCFMGQPAFFIRTYGCPVHCPWCDSAGTWHKDYVPKEIERLTVEQLALEAKHSQAPFVVITGGEPAVHDLNELCDTLHTLHIKVHLETSGAYEINGTFDWITVSPKRWKLPLPSNLMLADEYKFIIERPTDILYYLDVLETGGEAVPPVKPVWLHPEWSKREDREVLNAIVGTVKVHAGNFRAGYQLHKLYGVDAMDDRSKSLVPLGGDPKKGY